MDYARFGVFLYSKAGGNWVNTAKNKMNTQITQQFAEKFKRTYAYKMGGTQTLVFPNGQEFTFNDKEYYSGRGAKYNSSIRYDLIGIVIISKKELAAKLKIEKERAKRIKENQKIEKESIARYAENLATGIYGIAKKEYGTFIELSQQEIEGKFFDEKRLAKTLDISVRDASLLNSNGKTYVFAKQISTGKIIELYHSSLAVNNLCISFSEISENEYKDFVEQWGEKWEKYSHLIGQTDNAGHFVC